MEDDEKLLRIGEAARMIGCSSQTLRNYERRGILVPYYVFESGHRKYSKKQIDEFIVKMKEGGVQSAIQEQY